MRSSIKYAGIAIGILMLVEGGIRGIGFIYRSRAPEVAAFAESKAEKVLCLGESTTLGLWEEFSDSYPMQLKNLLLKHYNKDIEVIAPFHMGQNTSQMRNRIYHYLDVLKPKFVVFMVGANNEWSHGETRVGNYLAENSFQIKAEIFLDNLKIYKMLRWLYFFISDRSKLNSNFIYGRPEQSRYPPANWITDFAKKNSKAFVEMWKDDTQYMIKAAKSRGAHVILMSYPVMPEYLSVNELVSMAGSENVKLIRNDLVFKQAQIAPELLFHHDRWHPTKIGYELIANEVLQKIVDTRVHAL